MRQTAFDYNISARVRLSFAEVQHLLEQSALHYDAECRRAGVLGGFIYGWRNHFDPDRPAPGDEVELRASLDELDTVAKILEQPGGNGQLYKEVTEVAQRLRDEWRRMNGEENRHFKKHPKVVHRGHMYERTVGDFAQARRERAFAELWEEENEKDYLLARLLNMHLQGPLGARFKAERWPTQGEATDIASVIQWLGSHVGYSFLEEALGRADLWIIGLDAAASLKGHKLKSAGGDSVQCHMCWMLWPNLRGVVNASPCVVLQKLEIPDRG